MVASISDWIMQQNPWEVLAVLLAIAYLWFMVKERIEAWYCAFFSTAIYIILFWQVSLLMESLLNIYYLLMAVYGWWQWRFGGSSHRGILIHRWSLLRHCIAVLAIIVVSITSGWLLAEHTNAARPYIDSFTTWAAVFTTYLSAKKVLEHWLYWFVIDSVSIGLYVDSGMHLTALLFVWYVIMCVVGYRQWQTTYKQQPQTDSPTSDINTATAQ